ncbi:MAG: DUF4878 domain-containing protein [Gaiellales bacterium]|nr:MAG: DUF4878 domain-containing protein [Gaiellales bacterium]
MMKIEDRAPAGRDQADRTGKGKMKKIHARTVASILIFLVAAAAAFGCGGEGASPGEVVKEIFAAYNARDFERAYEFSSSSLREQGGSREEALAFMETSWPKGTEITDIEIIDETIDGDHATVEWSATIRTPELPEESGNATVRLVKEDGQWRLAP